MASTLLAPTRGDRWLANPPLRWPATQPAAASAAKSLRERAPRALRGTKIQDNFAARAQRPGAFLAAQPPSRGRPDAATAAAPGGQAAVVDEGGDEEFEEDGEFDEDEEYLEDGEDGEFEEGEDDAELDAGDLATTEWVELGVVKRPQGVRGGLRMLVETDWPSQRMKAGRKLYLRPPAPTGLLARGQPPAPPPLTFTVKSASFVTSRKDGLFYCLNLREVTDMEGAQALAGHVVLIPATARQQLTDPDEFYAQDLVGCQVHVKGGSSGGAVAAAAPIGVVRDLISGTGAHDTLLIELARTEDDVAKAQLRTCMVPFAKAIVPVVDVAARRLEIDPPEGLLDICKVVKLRPPRPPPSGAAGPGAKAPAGASTQAGSVAAGSSGGTRGRPSPPAGGGRATDGRGGRGAPAMPFGSTGQRQGDRATQPGRGGSMRSPRPPPPSAAAAGRGPQ